MFVYQSDCVGSDRVVCMCVCSESERGVFPALFLASHGGGKRNVEQVRSFPPLQELRSEKKKKAAKKPTPAAFPLRLFQEISNHSAEAALCAKASIVLSVQRTALLCVSTTSFGSRYSLQRLMFADLPHTSETTDNSPTTVPPASLVCVFFVAWIIKNCLRSCSALTSRAVLFFFCWDRAAASIQNLFAEAIHAQFWRCLFSL